MNGWTAETAAPAGQFNDAVDLMKERLHSMSSVVAAEVLPSITKMMDKINQATATGVNFANVWRGITASIAGTDISDQLPAQLDKLNNEIGAKQKLLKLMRVWFSL